MFKKFSELEGHGVDGMNVDDDEALNQTVPSHLRPKSASSLKPRRLFAPAKSHSTEDEEADTEIEDAVSTPSRQVTRKTATPKAPLWGPVSPPTTSRATRSKDVNLSSSPAGPSDDETPQRRSVRGTNRSPFDMWQRGKASDGSSSRKREAEDMITQGSEKKLRR